MLARPSLLTRPTTVRVAVYEQREWQVALRLESGSATHYVEGDLRRLPLDVGDFECVHAATMRSGS